MQYQHLENEEIQDLQSAFDHFDSADRKYSESPSPETFARRCSAMDLVSDMLLSGERDSGQSSILNHLANIVEKSGSQNKRLSRAG